MIRLVFFLILSSFAAASERPNILLMMVDDLGFADLGCYGSEIETPNIDKLAYSGLRFTQFYNTSKCETARVSLLSGLYHHQAGFMSLSRATTFAQVLKDAGYTTSMTGKWHLDKGPMDFGFEQYWGHLSSMTDFFIGDETFRYNHEVWDDFDPDFYVTDANVDYTFELLENSLKTGKPFFHYIAFNAPHYPLQAPKEDIEKYLGVYDVGWDEIRRQRFKKQQAMGLFPKTMRLPPMPEHAEDWDSLSEHDKQVESFRMAVFAAMVDRLDQNIGRLVDFLKEKGVYDNTLILFLSDNGACPFERSERVNIPPWKGDSFYLYDASWATVGNTPLKHYKQTQHEGGISTPLIVHWPGKIGYPGGWERSPGHLIDIMATFIDVGEAEYPDDPNVEPLQGKSLLPLFKGKKRLGHVDIYQIFNDCRALRHGDWKLVSFYGHAWELYNIAEDRAEQNNLASIYPEIVEELAARWHRIAEEVDQAPERWRKPVKATPSPEFRSEWQIHKKIDEPYADWEMPDF